MTRRREQEGGQKAQGAGLWVRARARRFPREIAGAEARAQPVGGCRQQERALGREGAETRLRRWAQEDLLLCERELGSHPKGTGEPLQALQQESDPIKSPTSVKTFQNERSKQK